MFMSRRTFRAGTSDWDGAAMDLSTDDDVTDLTVNPGERRRYNRRRPDSQPVPPYFSVFERMADALEAIAGMLDKAIGDRAASGKTAEGGKGSNVPSQQGRGT